MSAEDFIPIVSVIFGNITVIVIVAAWWRIRQRRIELQAEVQTKLIERFGSSAELVEFLKSRSGRDFVHGVQKGSLNAVQEQSFGGIRKAIILSFLALGLLFIWFVTGAEWVSWFGIIFLALGVGFLVASFVSMRLSRVEEPSASNHAPSEV